MTPLLTDLPRWSVFGWFLREGQLYKVHAVDKKKKVASAILPPTERHELRMLDKSESKVPALGAPPTSMSSGDRKQEKRAHESVSKHTLSIALPTVVPGPRKKKQKKHEKNIGSQKATIISGAH